MIKFAKFALSLSLVTLSGSAFAKTGPVDYALENAISHTDAQLAAVIPAAQDLDVPEPVIARATASLIQLADITDKCTHNGEVVSAFPSVYKMFPSEENSRIIKVFTYADAKGTQHRIEVYYTGGDWMQYGLAYLITDAGENRSLARAFFASQLSTSDRENGEVAPAVNPFDNAQLSDFLVNSFLDASGKVKPGLSSVASVPALQ